jgi:hypothetical protein
VLLSNSYGKTIKGTVHDSSAPRPAKPSGKFGLVKLTKEAAKFLRVGDSK